MGKAREISGSGLFDELTAAFRAADVDLAAIAWDAHGLLAMRAAEIAVVAVGHAEAEILPALILPLTAVDIARKHPKNGEAEQGVHQQREKRPKNEGINPTAAQENRQNARKQTCCHCRNQQRDI